MGLLLYRNRIIRVGVLNVFIQLYIKTCFLRKKSTFLMFFSRLRFFLLIGLRKKFFANTEFNS